MAYRHLRRELLAGRFRPGHRISPDASARMLGISQTPVREAIGLLQSDGLVEQVPGQGSFVARLKRKDFAGLWDIRIVLESYAAGRAAKRIQPRQMTELRKRFEKIRVLARQIRDAGDGPTRPSLDEQLAIADAAFHLTLLRAADNPRVLRIVDNLHVHSRLMQYKVPLAMSTVQEMAWLVRSHGRVLQAVSRRDCKSARREMRRQLRLSRKVYLGAMASGSGAGVAFPDFVRRDIRAQERETRP